MARIAGQRVGETYPSAHRLGQGPTGSPGAPGVTGPPGTGTVGPTGPGGPTGPASVVSGPTGPAGQAGSTSQALFFALMPSDNAATVAVGAAVQFPQDGPTVGTAPPTRFSVTEFTLPATGTYHIQAQVSIDEAGQLQVALNGVGLPNTVVGRATPTSQLVIDTLIAAVAGQRLSIINPSGNSTALTITPIAGGTHSVSATLLIERLS